MEERQRPTDGARRINGAEVLLNSSRGLARVFGTRERNGVNIKTPRESDEQFSIRRYLGGPAANLRRPSYDYLSSLLVNIFFFCLFVCFVESLRTRFALRRSVRTNGFFSSFFSGFIERARDSLRFYNARRFRTYLAYVPGTRRPVPPLPPRDQYVDGKVF